MPPFLEWALFSMFKGKAYLKKKKKQYINNNTLKSQWNTARLSKQLKSSKVLWKVIKNVVSTKQLILENTLFS